MRNLVRVALGVIIIPLNAIARLRRLHCAVTPVLKNVASVCCAAIIEIAF